MGLGMCGYVVAIDPAVSTYPLGDHVVGLRFGTYSGNGHK